LKDDLVSFGLQLKKQLALSPVSMSMKWKKDRK
jgi:hypothetical protein